MRAWRRRHPALGGDDVDAGTLRAYAEHDLVGVAPELAPSASREAIAVDAAEVAAAGADAAALRVPARLLVAPRGMLDGPDPLQPLALAQAWAAADPARRGVTLVPDVNHYTIVMGRPGAAAVADAIAGLASCKRAMSYGTRVRIR